MQNLTIPTPTIEIPRYPIEPGYSKEQVQQLKETIKGLLREKNGVLVAHYYTSKLIQDLANETGGCIADSLEMARFGTQTHAETLVVAGVRFMGETAKILNNEKTVLMPDLDANCSLDMGCPAPLFHDFCVEHPDRTVVVYANTSAEVKAQADWMVTSGIALDIIRHLHAKGEKILWAPDKHLGRYIQHETGADMLLWPGSCIVHERFDNEALADMRKKYPEAAVLVHPESPAEIIAQADYVGSTTGMIKAVQNMKNPSFIVATDVGIFAKISELAPHKTLLPAPVQTSSTQPETAQCPWMRMNSLSSIEEVLRTGKNEIHISKELACRAQKSIRRMLDFAGQKR